MAKNTLLPHTHTHSWETDRLNFSGYLLSVAPSHLSKADVDVREALVDHKKRLILDNNASERGLGLA